MAKRLYKSRNRMLFGVCGGIADFFNLDPTIIRLAAVLLTVCLRGAGIVAYIIGAIIIPDRPFADDGNMGENMRSANDYDRSDEEFDKHFEKAPKKG